MIKKRLCFSILLIPYFSLISPISAIQGSKDVQRNTNKKEIAEREWLTAFFVVAPCMVELNGQGREKNRGIAMRIKKLEYKRTERSGHNTSKKDHSPGDVGSWKCWQGLNPLATCLDILEIRKAL